MQTGNIPRPEYPRPDFKRESFQNLNGEWEFAFDDADLGIVFQKVFFFGSIYWSFPIFGRLPDIFGISITPGMQRIKSSFNTMHGHAIAGGFIFLYIFNIIDYIAFFGVFQKVFFFGSIYWS